MALKGQGSIVEDDRVRLVLLDAAKIVFGEDNR